MTCIIIFIYYVLCIVWLYTNRNLQAYFEIPWANGRQSWTSNLLGIVFSFSLMVNEIIKKLGSDPILQLFRS